MKNMSQCIQEKSKPAKPVKKKRKSCKNCVKGRPTGLTREILCWEKGIVSEDYRCSSHRFFIKDEIRKHSSYRCSDCEFFILHPNDYINTYGVCDLFSVRKCDGSIKKACSKFVKRSVNSA
jgi:hypothetical protein